MNSDAENHHQQLQAPPLTEQQDDSCVDDVRRYTGDVTRSILHGYSHASCALESDAHALTYMYPRIVKDLGFRKWQTSNFGHIVQLGSPRYSLSTCTDSDGKSRALYPAEARARMMSVKMEVSAEIMHKWYKKMWRNYTVEEYERLKAEDPGYFEEDEGESAASDIPVATDINTDEGRYDGDDNTNEVDASIQADDDLPEPSARVKRALSDVQGDEEEGEVFIPNSSTKKKKKKRKVSMEETTKTAEDVHKTNDTSSSSSSSPPLPTRIPTTKDEQKYVRKCFWKLLSIDKVLAPLAMDFVQQMGSACRVKRSGHLCHEDPDDLGGYYICDGVERYIENSLDMRSNYARTYFYTKRDARYDNTNLIECDYRANLDYTQKKASAFHLYLVVPNKIAHLHSRGIFKNMQSASSDAPPTTSSSSFAQGNVPSSQDTANHILFDFIPAAPPSNNEEDVLPDNIINNGTTNSIPNIGLSSKGHHGVNYYGSIFPAITVSLQNVNTTNLNLVGFFFLLGANSRADMMRIILPFVGNDWPDDDEISSPTNANIKHHPLQILADRSGKRLDEQHLALARTAYGVIYLQHVIPRYESVQIGSFESEGSVLCEVHHFLRDGPESLYPMPFPGGEFGEAEKIASSQARIDGWSRHMLLAYITSVMSGTGSSASSKTSTTSDNPSVSAGAIPEEDVNAVSDGFDGVSHVTTTSTRSGPSAALSAAMPATRKRQLDQFKTKPWLQSFERMKRSIFAENMPNIGTDNGWLTRNTKQRLLGSIVLKMLSLYLDLIEIEDVDHMNMKRIPGCGVVKSDLFRMTVQKGMGELCDAISKQSEEGKIFQFKSLVERYFNSTLIHSVMATGKWPVSTGSFDRSGVTKVHSYCSAAVNAEHIRRVCNNNLAPRSKEKGVHEFQESSSGILCCHHTPADEAAGIVTYLANGVRIRTGYDVESLKRTILNCERHGIIPMNDVLELVTNSHSKHSSSSSSKRNCQRQLRLHWNLNAESVLVFINGHPVGYSSDPQRTCTQLRFTRLNYGLPCDVSIAWVGGPIYNNGPLQSPYYNYISICGDAGGQVIPVFNLMNLWKIPLIVETFRYNHAHALDALIENGVLEYLDIEERSYMQIAKNCFHEVTKRSKWWLLHPSDPHRVKVISDMNASLPRYSSSSNRRYKLSDHILFGTRIPLVTRHSVYAPAPFTHAHVGGDLLTGVVASLIPYVNNSNANRITFGSGMKQQLMGVMPLNSAYRLRSTNLTMMLPKRSLVPTLISGTLSIGGIAGGALPKLIVIMCHKLNAEDETVHKRADYGQSTFIHRSFSTSTIKVSAARYQQAQASSKAYPTTSSSTVVKGSDPSIFSRPDINTVLGLRATSYHALHEDGSPKIGAVIEPGHARIGRTFVRSEYDHSSKSNIIVVRDKSEINQSKLTEIVSSVMKTTTDHGHGGGPMMHVFSESARLIDSGSKGCTENGQKGVIGFVSAPEDMPYIIVGDRAITPDIIMNPHAIPSRTTVGQPKESQQASIVLNATGIADTIDPWQGMSMSEQMQLLSSAGCNYQGTDYMYDGVTGSRTQVLIFRGFLEYSFLWHLALEKCKSRSTGGIDVRTRQPTAGGKNTGGNRDGPMEAANKQGHGATYVVNQAMNTASNTVKTLSCITCGMPATPYPRPSTAALRLIASSTVSNNSDHISNKGFLAGKNKNQKRRDFFSGGYCHICKSWQSVVPVDVTSSILVTSKEVNTEGIAWPLHLSRQTNDWSHMSEHELASRVLRS